jgi:hypothetical protein
MPAAFRVNQRMLFTSRTNVARADASKTEIFHRKAAKVAKEPQRGWKNGRRSRRCGWQIIPQNSISQRKISAIPLRLCGKSNAFFDASALQTWRVSARGFPSRQPVGFLQQP